MCEKSATSPSGFEVGDYAHFSFVQSITPPLTASFADEAALLPDALRAARQAYPIKRSLSEVRTVLTLTNAHRKKINASHNNLYAPPDAILVPYEGKDQRQQSLKVWPGLLLTSAVIEETSAYNLKNAIRYKVQWTNADETGLVRINDADEEGSAETKEWRPFKLPTASLSSKMRLGYAITIDSSQSRTLHGTVRVTQTDHAFMSLRRLCVALGRAPASVDIEVA